MRGFEGEIQQQPPPYSAKKVQGVKYYELARRGEEVPAETKEVTVYEFVSRGRHRRRGDAGLPALLLLGDLRPRPRPRPRRRPRAWERISPSCAAPGSAASAPRTPSRLPRARRAGGGGRAGWGRRGCRSTRSRFPSARSPPTRSRRPGSAHGQTVLVRELAGEEGDWVKLINRRREFIAVGTVIERIGTAGVGIVQPRVVFR